MYRRNRNKEKTWKRENKWDCIRKRKKRVKRGKNEGYIDDKKGKKEKMVENKKMEKEEMRTR